MKEHGQLLQFPLIPPKDGNLALQGENLRIRKDSPDISHMYKRRINYEGDFHLIHAGYPHHVYRAKGTSGPIIRDSGGVSNMEESRIEPVSPIKTTDELPTATIFMLSTKILSFVTSKRIFSFTFFTPSALAFRIGYNHRPVAKGTTGPGKAPGAVGAASGAGPVNPPVLYRLDNDFMIPAVPICKTEEFEIPLTRRH